MWRSISYWWRLKKLQRQERRWEDSFERRLAEARKTNDAESVEKIYGEWGGSQGEFEDLIGELQNRYLLDQARRYQVPVPSFNAKSGVWIESNRTGKWRLKPEPLAELRTKIREERQSLLVWIGALTGLVGAIAALIALLGHSASN